jgi:hypothetical protein
VGSSAPTGQHGKGVDGSFGAAELIDESAEGGGPTFSLLISRSQLKR